jgi:hypothetical protein
MRFANETRNWLENKFKREKTQEEHFEDKIKREQTQLGKGLQLSLIELKEEIYGIREEVVRNKGDIQHQVEQMRQEMQTGALDWKGALTYMSKTNQGPIQRSIGKQ